MAILVVVAVGLTSCASLVESADSASGDAEVATADATTEPVATVEPEATIELEATIEREATIEPEPEPTEPVVIEPEATEAPNPDPDPVNDSGAGVEATEIPIVPTPIPIVPTPTPVPDPIGWIDDECHAPPIAEPDPDRPSYTGNVTINPDSGKVIGSIDISFAPDIPTDQIVIRLWPNGPREAAGGTVMTTRNITVDDAPANVDESDATTRTIALASTLAPGDRVTVSMDFDLTVPGPARARVARGADSEPWMRLGSALPLLAWEPGVGWATDPGTAQFAEAVTSPTADYAIKIDVPSGYDVLATGDPDDAGVWRGEAIRDFSISVGQFALVERTVTAPDPVHITMGVDQSVNEDPEAYMDRIEASLIDFSETFGPYPWPTLSVALTPGIGGGIEFPTHIMLGDNTIGRTTPHEVAHMFFYSLVGNNQGRNPWMDEGLASYAEFIHEGRNLTALAYPADQLGNSGQPLSWFEQTPGYYESVYVQPAIAIATLGPREQVNCALEIYLAQNAFGVATPDDFFDAVEVVFPDAADVLASFGISR